MCEALNENKLNAEELTKRGGLDIQSSLDAITYHTQVILRLVLTHRHALKIIDDHIHDHVTENLLPLVPLST